MTDLFEMGTDTWEDWPVADNDPDFAEVDEPAPKHEPKGFWTVAIYRVALEFGGPEEGGWWYDTGTRVDTPLAIEMPLNILPPGVEADLNVVSPKLFSGDTAERSASEWRDLVQAVLDITLNKDLPDKSSSISSGVYEAHMYEGWPPECFPVVRPHYE